MLKIFIAGATLALIATTAIAQEPPKAAAQVTDQQIERAQSRVYAAEAELNLLYARRLQAANAEAATQAVATAAWWKSWWEAMYPPPPAPPASAAPQK